MNKPYQVRTKVRESKLSLIIYLHTSLCSYYALTFPSTFNQTCNYIASPTIFASSAFVVLIFIVPSGPIHALASSVSLK